MDNRFAVVAAGRLRGIRRVKPIGGHQLERVFVTLRTQLDWINRGTHHAPRIQDLRHTFVVKRILLWQQHSVDVHEAMGARMTAFCVPSMLTQEQAWRYE